jgi:hypothetical protein
MAQTVPELRDLVSGFVRVDKSSRISELLSEPVEAPNERLLPGNRADEDRVVAATIPTVTELAATPTKIIANSTQNYTPQTEKFGEIRTAPQEVLATRGGLPAVNTPTTLLSSKNGSLTVEKTSVEFPETDYAEDHYQDELIATILDLSQPRNQVTVDVRQSEVSRIGELDVSRRSAGLIHQVRESDARLDVGLSIVRTTYEAPSDQIQDGAAIALDPGAFMAELIRADTMLHVADVAIEQIDLHLDYLIGLAEEAASGDSRDRGALDEMYQAVKSNIIDSLAQTVEVQGENILAGGDGPRGEFVIRLSEGRTIGQEHDIAIPSMRVKDFSPDLFYSTIRTQESASAAIGHIELASADTAETRDMIAEQRTLIRQLITLENSLPGSRRF